MATSNIKPQHTNTTVYNGGGICNQIIRNVCVSEIARKYNLKFSYICYPETLELGIPLFIGGNHFYPTYMEFDDDKFEEYIDVNGPQVLQQNIYVHPYYFQTPFTARYLRQLFSTEPVRTDIIQANKYRERYEKNVDLCIHVRLGDAAQFNPGLEYYDHMLQNVTPWYDTGYIVSDEIGHPLCQELIQKYRLTVFEGSPIETLMFGSTCKYILTSGGTFSWMMGVLGFFSQVYCPNMENLTPWHGNIFVFEDWIKST